MATRHAFEFLSKPEHSSPAIAAVFGSDATLRAWSLATLTDQGDMTQFDGDAVKWTDLRDDLATASLFDFGEKRTIIVRTADKFVSDHRSDLEAFTANPSSASRLILELESLTSTTRLYKAIDKDHLLVVCTATVDKKTGVTAAGRRQFLTNYVAGRHQTKITAGAADLLIDLLGEEIGMLDTEIAKLALYRDPGATIDEALVGEVVSGWQGQTVWQITDAIASGDAAEALRQLDKLMSGGQRPIALLPQIAFSLRRLGMATAVVLHREANEKPIQLDDALSATGMRWPAELQRAKGHLKGLGRERGKQLLEWLLDADLRLKGTHSPDGRDRFLLEQFVVKLAKGAR